MPVVRKLVTTWKFNVDQKKVTAFTRSIDKAKVRVDRVSKSVKNLGNKIKGLGKGVAAFGAALTAGIILPALKLEDSLKDTMTIAQMTGEEFKRVESEMMKFGIKLSNQLGISAVEINKGFYQVISTGAKAMSTDFVELSDVALKMAKVVGLTPSEAIERLNDAINAFGLSSEHARSVADRFFQTSILASLSVPQLTMAMRDAGPAAAGFGVNLNQTLVALAAFAQGGIKGAEAGTAFKMIIKRLNVPTSKAAKMMKKLHVEVFNVDGSMRGLVDILADFKKAIIPLPDKQRSLALEAIAGGLALSKFSAIISKDMEKLKEWEKQLESAGGAIETALVIKMSSGLQKLNQLKQRIINTAAVIGLDLIPKINEMGDAFSDWMRTNTKEINEWGKAFTDNVQSSLSWLFDNRKAIVSTAKALGLLWATTKVIAFANAIRLVIVALAPIISGVVVAALNMVGASFVGLAMATGSMAAGLALTVGSLAIIALGAYAVVRAFQEMFRARKAFNDLEKGERARDLSADKMTDRRRVQVLSRAIAEGKLDKFKGVGPGFRRSIERQTGLSYDVFLAREKARIAAEKAVNAKGKPKIKPKDKPDIDLGDMDVTGADKLKSKIEKELEKVFAPGFSKGLKLKFHQFLLGRTGSGKQNLSEIYSKILSRTVTPESLGFGRNNGSAGAGTLIKVAKTNQYYITSNTPKEVADEIERNERSMANDFGISSLTSAKINF